MDYKNKQTKNNNNDNNNNNDDVLDHSRQMLVRHASQEARPMAACHSPMAAVLTFARTAATAAKARPNGKKKAKISATRTAQAPIAAPLVNFLTHSLPSCFDLSLHVFIPPYLSCRVRAHKSVPASPPHVPSPKPTPGGTHTCM